MAFFRIMRVKAIVTFVTLMVALHLLNVSVDPADHTFGYEDLSVNEIESCIELVLEHVLKHGNAVKETEDHDGATNKAHTRIIYIFAESTGLIKSNTFELLPTRTFMDRPGTLSSLALPILAPPPRTA